MEHTHTQLQQQTTTTTPSPPPTPTHTTTTAANKTCPTPSSQSCPTSQFDVVNHSVHDTLQIVAALLSMAVQRNDRQYNPLKDPVTLFHSRAVPRISIEAYLTRILQYIPFTNEVLLNVLVFLERIGGLEGMQLKSLSNNNNNNAESSTTASPSSSSFSCTSPPSPRSASCSSSEEGTTSVPSSSLARTLAAAADPFSCPASNSDPIFPMIQKRGRDEGREEHETASTHDGKRQKSTSTTMTTSGTIAGTQPISSQQQYQHHQHQPYVPVSPATTPMTAPLSPSTVSCSPVEQEQEQGQAVLPKNNGFRINSFNIHRLLITTVMVAAKFTSDLFYSNARYAKVGGLNLPELNQLELEFLFTSRFELNVKVDEIQRVGDSLLQFRAELVQQQLQQQQQMMSRMMMMATPSLPVVTSAYPAHPAQHYQPSIFVQAVEQPKTSYCPTATSIPSPATSTTSSAVSTPALVTPVPAPAFAVSGPGARPHLLSPPEEKRPWSETEVHEF
ncbi:MAG: cyclin-domain-containing protein [Podila humilis]|nr:MAG: cyclin-domain-containing protein [Podila humilis]